MTTKGEGRPHLQIAEGGREATVALGAIPSGRLEFVSGAAHLRIGADPDLGELMRARFQGPPPRVSVERGSVVVRYPGLPMPTGWRRRRVDVTLNPSVSWELAIRRGVADARVDLQGMDVTAVSIGGGSSDVEVLLPQPRRPVGIRIAGGAKSLRLLRPKGVPVRLRVGGGSSKLAFDEQSFGAIGGGVRLQSERFDEAGPSYDIRVGGGASRLTIGAV